jgi:hypothetical protein
MLAQRCPKAGVQRSHVHQPIARAVPCAATRKLTAPGEAQMVVAQGKEWLDALIARFNPVREKAQTVTTLDFEKPLLELDKRIKEVRISMLCCADAGTESC